MVKIVFLISSLKSVGPIFSLRSIIKNLPKDKFETFVISLSKNLDQDITEDFIQAGSTIFSLELSKGVQILFGKTKLERLLRKIHPRILHSQGLSADFMNTRVRTSAIKMSTLRCFPHDYFINQYGAIKGKFILYFFLRNLEKLDYRVACSHSISNRINPMLSYSFVPISNGLDMERFPRRTISLKEEIRKSLNLPLNRQIFIVVGNLIEGKNPRLILEAFLNNHHNDLLIFLGSGFQMEQLQHQAKDESGILFLGQVNNVKEYLQSCDYFISASLSEGMPNAVLEAMGTGLPVILSNIPSHEEIYNYNYACGSLFESEKIESLQNAIKKVKSKNYDVMSEASYHIISENFSALKMGEKYSAFYESII